MPEILKNIKAEDRLKKIRIVSENDDVMGGQPEADGMKENDNNAIFDLACSVMHALAEVAKVDQKAIPQILDALGDSRTAGASQRIVNEVNKLAKAAQTAANQANDKANTANTAAAIADKKAVAAQNTANAANTKANQVPNPVVESFVIGNTSTSYKLMTVDQVKTLLSVPILTSALSDNITQAATPKMVNEVNRAAKAAQTAANQANDKANTAQSRADSAYNFANSKQDKLEFIGNGRVMREGAYGVGSDTAQKYSSVAEVMNSTVGGFFIVPDSTNDLPGSLGVYDTYGISIPRHRNSYGGALFFPYGVNSPNNIVYRTKYEGRNTDHIIYSNQNTRVDKNGVITSRSSNVDTASEAFVRTLALGVHQVWADVTGSRSANNIYTNTTGKPIYVSISVYATRDKAAVLFVDNVYVSQTFAYTPESPQGCVAAIVPAGSTYSVRNVASLIKWSELR